MSLNVNPALPVFQDPRQDNDTESYTWIPSSMGGSLVAPPVPAKVQSMQGLVAAGGPEAPAARHYLDGLRRGVATVVAAKQARAKMRSEMRMTMATMLDAFEALLPKNALAFGQITRNTEQPQRAYCPGTGRVLSISTTGAPIDMQVSPVSRQELVASETCASNGSGGCPLCTSWTQGFHAGAAKALQVDAQGLLS